MSKTGRPSKLNDEVKKILIDAVILGCDFDLACSYAGIARVTFYKWIQRGKDETEGPYHELYIDLKKAEAMNAVRALASIQAAARAGKWQAAAFLLERRHGYKRDAETPQIDLTIDIKNTDVQSLLETVHNSNLTELITGPVIDIDEE